jgi:dipeptidyl aminopeptidase/acylaminoacyl peptidase
MKRIVLALALCGLLAPAGAQTSDLTVARIMRDQATWIGASPSRASWSENGEWLYFNWNPKGANPSDSLYKVSRDGGTPVRVSPGDRRSVRPTFSGWGHGSGRYTADFGKKVFESGGDIYIYSRAADALERLTATTDREAAPRFSLDEAEVVFQADGNVFSVHLDSGAIRQLTDLRKGEERKDRNRDDEQEKWLRRQQTDLFDVLRDRISDREAREEARERDSDAAQANRPPVHHYGDGNLSQLQLDPTGRYASFYVSPQSPRERTIVQDYVTESGFAEDRNSRPKVGVDGAERPLFIQDLESGEVIEVDLTQLEGAFDTVPAHLEPADEPEARSLSARGPFWSGDGAYAVLDVTAADHKDRWLALLDPATGDLTLLDRQSDEAWIGGPGIRSFFGGGSGWLPDNRRFFFQSEATGYSHLYTVDVANGEVEQLTDGEFEVFSPSISKDGRSWFFTSSETTPFERHFYRMPIDGGARTRLTGKSGNNQVTLHPDEDRAAIRFSATTEPPDLYLKRFGHEAERLTESPTDEWLAYPWRTGELIEIPASDGVMLPTQIFRPENPNGGAVIFVHGAGYLQNVHRWWSSYSHEYMFHNLLADLGYTVLNVDYRASSGYGRDWRTAIYRYMGGRDLQDQVDASRYVDSELGIDPERVFIYGGSYGGFITLMALFNEPEHFGGGAALRSVTDWAHYNHGYTSNILNTPVNDSLAYARSSPINFADGLEDPLLMAHGVVDTNVQYQDIIRLAQRLIELGKTDWELASFPVEGHGFVEPTSWTDEYSRILKLIGETVGPNRFR